MTGLEWVESLVVRYGLFRVLAFPVVALSTLAGLSAWFSLTGSIIFSAILVSYVSIILFALASVRNRSLQAENKELRRALAILRSYAKDLAGEADSTTVLWREEYIVSKNGDLDGVSRLTIRVNTGTPLHFIEMTEEGEPLTPRERSRVRFAVSDGEGGGRLPVIAEWVSSSAVRLWIHLHSPLAAGQRERTIVTEFSWPHMLPELGKGGVEELSWTPERPTERLEFVVVLDKSFKRTHRLGFTLDPGQPAPTQKREGNTWRIEGSFLNLEKDRTVTLSLDAGSQ